MNNLHRELAPISDAAWAQIEEEASRTLKRYLAGRRVVDVQGPAGTMLSAVGTGHLRNISAPGDGILARQREVKALVELRVPFELDRQMIDDVERGANDSDWQPTKDAAKKIAFAEDGAIFEGYEAGGIQGIRQGTSNPVVTLPADVANYPDAIAHALSELRIAGVNGPYSVVLGAEPYTAVAEARDHGYPVIAAHPSAGRDRDHLGSGDHRRLCADHPRRRFRPAYRPGFLDRLSEPYRRRGPPLFAGELHLPAVDQRSRGGAGAGAGRVGHRTGVLFARRADPQIERPRSLDRR